MRGGTLRPPATQWTGPDHNHQGTRAFARGGASPRDAAAAADSSESAIGMRSPSHGQALKARDPSDGDAAGRQLLTGCGVLAGQALARA